ncbi:hypothetical protein [Bulleidia sp. zg-1006]|uniref:hypothetical protein n=1 Tax=Bulleidia sp. zg-1006 TaxID=2806552 RepID=UPI00193A5FC2|nr:hypothetical protein [Bulleidia sp. zg-1006]QRG87122.1 hypothetical protein JOS54_02100 [Bulleidia sp. zg-1006]
MSASDGIVILVIGALVAWNIRYVIKNGVDSCSGDCNGACKGHCKWVGDVAKARRHISRINKIKAFFHLT